MIIILVLSILLVVGILMAAYFWDDLEIVGFIIAIFSGIFLLFAVVIIPLNRMSVNAFIEEFKAVERTAEIAREKDNWIESAAFQLKISEMNQKLARQQYWRSTIFDIWIPGTVMQLKPIE